MQCRTVRSVKPEETILAFGNLGPGWCCTGEGVVFDQEILDYAVNIVKELHTLGGVRIAPAPGYNGEVGIDFFIKGHKTPLAYIDAEIIIDPDKSVSMFLQYGSPAVLVELEHTTLEVALAELQRIRSSV